MSVPSTNPPQSDNQVVFKNLTSVHLECLIEHPGSASKGCLNVLTGNLLKRISVPPKAIEESITLLAPGQAFRPKNSSPGQRWLFRERFSGKLLFHHEITETSDREVFFQLQSKEGDEEVEVLFHNDTTLDLELYWVDFDGRERLMQTLAPNESYKRHTFANHTWMARDAYSKIPLDVIEVDPHVGTYAIRSDKLVSRPGDETVNVVFKNVTPIPLTFNWVGSDGKEETKFSLGPGEPTKEGMDTTLGHVWRARGGPENEEIKLILPSAREQQFYEVKMAEFEGNPATEITFVNETMLEVDLYLVRPAGEIRFKGLSPKESFVQATFITHKWLVREANTGVLLASIMAQTTPTTVNINSSHVRSQPSAQVTKARFDNRSPFIIRVVSIDPEGQETELETLLPGQDGTQHESNDHVWRFIDDITGREISQFIARPGETLQHEIVVKSIHSRSPASIRVHNETHLTVDVIWLDKDGKEQHMQTLSTGDACNMDTFLTHPWLVRDSRSGHLLESIFGQMAAQRIDITDEDIISYHRGGQTSLKVTNSLPFSVELFALSEKGDESDLPLAALAPNDDIHLDVQTGVVLRARQRRSRQLIANLIPKDVADEFELKLRAVHDHYATEIEFVNESPLTVTLQHVDSDGVEHEEGTLEPFDFVVCDTFATHPWVVRDKNSGVPVANTIGLSRPQTLRIKADHLYHMQRPDRKMVRVKFTNGSRIALDVFRVDENDREKKLFTTKALEPGSLEDFFKVNLNSLIPQETRSSGFPAGSIFRAYKAGTRRLADVYILNDTDGQEYTLHNKLVREGLRSSGELREGEVALFSEKDFGGKAWIARTDVPFFRDLGDADNVEDSANKFLGDIEDFFKPLTDIIGTLLISAEEKERKQKEREQREKDFLKSLDNRISSIKVGPNTQAIIFGRANFGGKNDVILMDAPDLSLTDVGDDQISSLQIVTTASALETKITSSAKLSEEYHTEVDASGKTTLVRDTAGTPLTFPVYRSIITFPPDVDEVDVWAMEALTIEVEGQAFDIDLVKPARVSPNLAHKLLINIRASSLGTPALQLRTNTMRERDRFLVFPDQDVSRKLAALQPGQMWQDRAQLGLPAELSEQDAAHVQSAMQTVASAAGYRDSSSPREGRYIVTDNMEYAAWSLDFGGDGAAGGTSYRPLSDKALAELTAGAELIEPHLTQGFLDNVWTTTKQGAHMVGEGTAGAAKGVNRVVVQPVLKKADSEVLQPTAKFARKEILDPVNDNVIQPAKEIAEEEIIEPVRRDVIEPAAKVIKEDIVDPVVDTVKKVKDIEAIVQEALAVTIQAGETLNTVLVDTPEKALGFCEHFLTELGAPIMNVVDWVSDTFSWNKIVDMQDVVTNLIDAQLENMQALLPDLADRIVDEVEASEETIMSQLDELVAQFDVQSRTEPQISTIQLPEFSLPSEVEDQLNWLVDKIVVLIANNMKELDFGIGEMPEFEAQVDQLLTLIDERVEDAQELIEASLWQSLDHFAEAFIQPDKIAEHIIAGILILVQKLAKLGFDTVKSILTKVFEIFATIIGLFQKIIKTELDIPFLSELFTSISGGKPLTIGGIIALGVAIPALPLFKLMAADIEPDQISLVPITLETTDVNVKKSYAIWYCCFQFLMILLEPAHFAVKKKLESRMKRAKLVSQVEGVRALSMVLAAAEFILSGVLQGCTYPMSFNRKDIFNVSDIDEEERPVAQLGVAIWMLQNITIGINGIGSFYICLKTPTIPRDVRLRQAKLDKLEKRAAIVNLILSGITAGLYISQWVTDGERIRKSTGRAPETEKWFVGRNIGNMLDAAPGILASASLIAPDNDSNSNANTRDRERSNQASSKGKSDPGQFIETVAITGSVISRVALIGIVIGRVSDEDL